MKFKITFILLYCIHFFAFKAHAQSVNFTVAINGSAEMKVLKTAVDAQGNIYSTGFLKGNADFDPSPTSTYTLDGGFYGDVFISKLSSTGTFIWAKQIIGPDVDEGKDIAIDNNGNVIVTGFFKNYADFDPGAATNNMYAGSVYKEIFVLKLDSAGNYLNAFQLGGNSEEVAYGLTTDMNNDIIITGDYSGSSFFGNGAYFTTSSAASNIFVAKYNTNGLPIWAKNIGNTFYLDRGNEVITDADGNVYVTGFFNGGTADFDPGPGVYDLTTNQSTSYILKLDSAGNFVWARKTGGEHGTNIAVDNEKSVYVLGYYQSPSDYDPGTGVYNLPNPISGYNSFLSKLDSNGNFVWAQTISNQGFSYNAFGLLIDPLNNIYIAGAFAQTFDFDFGIDSNKLTAIGDGDIFVSKLSKNGNLIWVTGMGGPTREQGTAVALMPDGRLIVAGNFTGSVDFDPSANTNILSSNGLNDAFIMVLNNSLAPLSVNEVEFSAKPAANNIRVAWSYTASDLDEVITLEKSNDGISFADLEKFDVQKNSIGVKTNFSSLDNEPTDGNNFYRLAFQNITGENTYSKIIACRYEHKKTALEIYPNPANDFFTVAVESEGELEITNAFGQTIQKTSTKDKHIKISTAHLEKGIYYVSFLPKNKTPITKQLIVR